MNILLSRCCDLHISAQIFAPPKFRLKSVWQILWLTSVWTFCRRLTGEQLQEDDRLRQEVIASIFLPGKYISWNLRKCCLPKYSNDLLLQNQVDRLAQDFSLASKEESLDAIDIGEKMLELMDRWGFMSFMMTRILTVGVIMTKISSWWRWWSSRQRTPWQSMSRQWWLFGRLGFSPSVTWPGYLRLTELLLKVNKRSFCDYRAIVDFISGGTSVKSSKVCGSVVPPGLPRKRQK